MCMTEQEKIEHEKEIRHKVLMEQRERIPGSKGQKVWKKKAPSIAIWKVLCKKFVLFSFYLMFSA